MEIAPGIILDNEYRIDKLLGQGGMGAVYKGLDLTLSRDVAIKVMHEHIAQQPGFRDRFLHEARAAASLQHAGIVPIYAFSRNPALLYIVMAFVPGPNLLDWFGLLEQKGVILSLAESLAIGAMVADVLAFAHRRGVYHRDVKPANILLQTLDPGQVTEMGLSYQPVLTDFGLARMAEGGKYSITETTMGTPAYMSPEQCEGLEVDGRSDLYSLGIMLYEMSTGRVPFQMKTALRVLRAHTQDPPPPPRSLNPDLPSQVEEIILRALAKSPAQRYESATEMAAVLRAVRQDLPQRQEREPALGRGSVSLDPMIRQETPEPGPVRIAWSSPAAGSAGGGYIAVVAPDGTTREVPLGVRSILSIGRGPNNDLVLPDPKASRQHAQVVLEAGKYRITDLHSINGILLCAELQAGLAEEWPAGQMLRVGECWLRLETAAMPPPQSGPGVEREGVQESGEEGPSMPSPVDMPSAGDEAAVYPRIVILWPDEQRMAVPFAERPKLTIGRDPSNDLVLPDPKVSRRHVQVQVEGMRYLVTDLKTTNGTLLARELVPGQAVEWPAGQMARIAGYWLRLALPPGPQPQAVVKPERVPEPPKAAPPTPPPAPASSQPEPAPPGGAHIVILKPGGCKETFAFGERRQLTIGRGEGNDLVLSDDQKVSRKHVQVRLQGIKAEITDLSSLNGTLLGNDPLLPGVWENWPVGRIASVGEHRLRFEPGSVQPEVSAEPAIQVSLEPTQVTVAPGKSVDLTIRILNRQQQVDHFSIVIERIPVEWVTCLAGELRLAPGDERTVTVQINPPQAPTSTAGEHPFRVRVVSMADQGRFAQAHGVLTIQPFYALKVGLEPKSFINQGKGNLRLANQGNTMETLTLSGPDPGGTFGVVLGKSQTSLQAGQEEDVPLALRLSRRRPVVGMVQSQPFSVSAATMRGEVQSATGSLQVKPFLPTWAPPILMLLVAFIVGAAMWVQKSIKDEKKAAATQTAVYVAAQTAIVQATRQYSETQTATVAIGQQTATAQQAAEQKSAMAQSTSEAKTGTTEAKTVMAQGTSDAKTVTAQSTAEAKTAMAQATARADAATAAAIAEAKTASAEKANEAKTASAERTNEAKTITAKTAEAKPKE